MKLEFNDIKTALTNQFKTMSMFNLYKTDVSKDQLWDTYLGSFPEGTNPIFRERTEHDCQCCKQFIRVMGNVVAIKNNKLVSIWDLPTLTGPYAEVAYAMSKLVKSAKVRDRFMHYEYGVGKDFNEEELENGKAIRWDHYHVELPGKHVFAKDSIPTMLGDINSGTGVFKRGLDEISLAAVEITVELIEQGSLYRGEEHLAAVNKFKDIKEQYDEVPDDEKTNWCWENYNSLYKIRSTVIGTLLIDISNGVELDEACHKFGHKMDGYKRPKTIATKRMIETAEKELTEAGFIDSLPRRHAKLDDISAANTIYVDNSVRKEMNMFDSLKEDVPLDLKNLDKLEEMPIKDFIENILPKVTSMELLLENRHVNSLMSVTAPQNPDAKKMFSHANKFAWVYKGEVADSLMKERVAKAGGKTDGVLRMSLQWNEEGKDQNIDFDAWCIEPNGNKIYYSDPTSYLTKGNLDVDIQSPGPKVAVENITWPDINFMKEGNYQFIVHNYSDRRSQKGFTAEIEYNGQVWEYTYDKSLAGDEQVKVAKFSFSKTKGIEFIEALTSTTSSREVWGMGTNKLQRVKMIMNSPNHWDGSEVGNKHYFFILDNCKNPDSTRGFFNEHLSSDLTKHRKTLEMLGSRMRVEPVDEQLSGLGFSSTKRNHVLCKVTGSFTRMIKIIF